MITQAPPTGSACPPWGDGRQREAKVREEHIRTRILERLEREVRAASWAMAVKPRSAITEAVKPGTKEEAPTTR